MNPSVLFYDGDCSLCQREANRWKRWMGDRCLFESFRDPEVRLRYELELSESERAVQLLLPGGRRFSGAEAVARMFGLAWWGVPLKILYFIPGLRQVWEYLYENVALYRFWISRKLQR